MSHHPRVEEVSDSDSDPDDMDPGDFDPRNIISPVDIPSTTASRSANAAPPPPASSARPPPTRPQETAAPGQQDVPRHFQCLYPVYFDKTRSRAQGRMVSRKLAVANPLAREIVDAVQLLGLRVGFEGDKLHPKDWANPGRVRVGLKQEDGTLMNDQVKNKHHLYILVGKHLQTHPTTEQSPFKLRVRGLPTPETPPPPPSAPRGWKMGTILPFHSPAVSGGGVSDNPFKEAMQEMQQQGMGGMGGDDTPGGSGGGGGGKKKKDKKKGKG